MNKYDIIGRSTYEAYRSELEAQIPDWDALSNDQRDGFTAAAVHVAASLNELVTGKGKQRYILSGKPEGER